MCQRSLKKLITCVAIQSVTLSPHYNYTIFTIFEVERSLYMIYYEQEMCGVDSKPKETSEVYRSLNEVDPEAAQQILYTVEVPLGIDKLSPRTDDT